MKIETNCICQRYNQMLSLLRYVKNLLKSLSSFRSNQLEKRAMKAISNFGLKFRIIIPFLILTTLLSLAVASFSTGRVRFSIELLLTVIGAFLAVIGLGLLLARQITRRIAQIISAAEQAAQGNLRVRIDDDHHDEIGRLARAFNLMASNIDHLYHSRDLLSRTMSPAVRQSLIRQGLDFRSMTQQVSILFIDIQDFTTITERHNTEQLVYFLNDYYTTIANLVHVGDGIIGKYGGDSILAYFGAPDAEPPEKSSTSALLTALALQATMEELSHRWLVLGLSTIRVGIGISIGEVVAGPIGSEEQFEYTVIGDAVNLAARLQDLTRSVPGFDIIISSEVYQALEKSVRDRFQVVSLQQYEQIYEKQRTKSLMQFVDFGEVLVKGKKGPVHVYGIP